MLGHYQLEAKDPTAQLDLKDKQQIRFVRGDKVIEGTYVVTANKMADFHIKVNDSVRMTLHFQCVDNKEAVQVCVHGDKVECVDLKDYNSRCTPGPVIDGSKINRPPK